MGILIKRGEKMYCAIIGDIVGSKKIQERSQAQQQLEHVLGAINDTYQKDIASNFIITLGDEFQGVLNDANSLIDIIQKIKFALYPINIRFGLGFGQINTNLNKLQAIGADGPAFYNARDAIETLKSSEKKYESIQQLVYIKYSNDTDPTVDLVNAAFALCNQIEANWTQKQMKIVSLMRENNNSQIAVAKDLDINKSSVSKSVTASKYYNYFNAMNAIQKSITDIWERIYEN